jgi:hypothetical protein
VLKRKSNEVLHLLKRAGESESPDRETHETASSEHVMNREKSGFSNP